ncbi:MAG TPA: hypothetical protein DDW36_03055 [Candidatus Magasanikbacteria bacterium]|nr:hypothetical protein [Candidatus Magasanikbacteria bacterium]
MRLLTFQDLKKRNDLQLTLLAVLATTVYLIIWSIVQHPITPLYLLLLMVLFVAIIQYPKIGVYLMIFGSFVFINAFSLHPLYLGGVEIKLYLVDFIIGFTVLSIVWRLLNKRFTLKEHLPRWTPVETVVSFFVALVLITFVRSLFLPASIFDLNFSTLKNYGLYAVVYILVMLLFKEKHKREELMSVVFYSGIVVLGIAIAGIIRGEGFWAALTPLSTFGSRFVAMGHTFFTVIFSLLLSGLWFVRKRITMRSWVLLSLFLVCIVVFFVGLVRHLWVAVAALGVIWFIYLQRPVFKDILKLMFGACGILLVSGFFVYTFFVSYGLETRGFDRVQYALEERFDVSKWFQSGTDTSVGYRYALWSTAYSMFFKQPVFGIGFGRWLPANDAGYLFEAPVRQVHNFYIAVALQMGFVGAVVVALWLVLLAKSALRDRAKEFNLIRFWSESSMILFLLSSFFATYWELNVYIVVWWIFLALWRLEGGGERV